MTLTEKDFTFIPEGAATAPPKGQFFQAVRDSWWLTHPTKGLPLYRGRHPQCNTQRGIAEKLPTVNRMPWDGCEVKFFPLVLVPIDPRDYA